jgi:hypothetical protein
MFDELSVDAKTLAVVAEVSVYMDEKVGYAYIAPVLDFCPECRKFASYLEFP